MDLSQDLKTALQQNSLRFISSSYTLSKQLAQKLTKHKLELKTQLLLYSDDELAQKFDFTPEEIAEINQKIKFPKRDFDFFTLANLDDGIEYISIKSKGFNRAFGGDGLSTRRLTQITGEAGVGKSQICLELCFRVQLPESEGGLRGEALYLDTEDGFRPERITQIAQHYYQSKFRDSSNLLKFKLEETLSRVHVRKANTNADDLCNIILNGELDSFLECHGRVRILVVDSITYHFRYDYVYSDDFRNQQLGRIACKLKQLAYKHRIAILITNQVKLDNEPALSDQWNSTCPVLLFLKRVPTTSHEDTNEPTVTGVTLKQSLRQCYVLKSPHLPPSFNFNYCLTENGIEDHE